jgi:hypothetical protein
MEAAPNMTEAAIAGKARAGRTDSAVRQERTLGLLRLE